MRLHSRFVVFGASIALFALALTQDGFYLDRMGRDAWAPGWGEFAFGWLSLFSGTLAWLGNPFLIASWIALYRGKGKSAGCLAIVALAFMLSFLLNTTIVDSEAGTASRISGYGFGYWLWLSSAIVVASGSWLTLKDSAREPPIL